MTKKNSLCLLINVVVDLLIYFQNKVNSKISCINLDLLLNSIRDYIPLVHELFALINVNVTSLYDNVLPIITKICIIQNIDIVFLQYKSLYVNCKEKIQLYKQITTLISEIERKKVENNVTIRYSFGDVNFKEYLDKYLINMKIEDLRNLKRNFSRILNML